ncbi:MAG: mandelate racemase/muconate lactonizing protein [Bryobacterales bacterium]|nr:mandelate racemase/muconate lactonizing protein [Bryobacterales bacterium]
MTSRFGTWRGRLSGCRSINLIGGPIRKQVPVYSHGGPRNLLDKAECKAWAQQVKTAPEAFTAFKFGFGGQGAGQPNGPYNPTLDGAVFRKTARECANLREASATTSILRCIAPDSSIRAARSGCVKPSNRWIRCGFEDPLTVRYSEARLELKRSTRVPLLAGEKVELVEGFRPYLDNQVLDMIHPDVAYSGGITGCRKIEDYTALTRTPVGLHSGPCSLIRLYASMHPGAAIQNFFTVEDAVGAFRGNKEKMAQGPEPVVRNSVFPAPEGSGLALN